VKGSVSTIDDRPHIVSDLSLKRRFVSRMIDLIPFSVIRQIGGGKLILPYYHLVGNAEVPHIGHLYKFKSVRQFIEDIEFLLGNYEPMSLTEVIQNIRKGVSQHYNCFLLSFDDGLREIYDIISPILLEKGVPATFFLNSAFIDNRELCFEHKASILARRIEMGISPGENQQIRRILAEGNILRSNVTEVLLKVDYLQHSILDRIGEMLWIDFDDYLRRNQPYLTSDQIRELIKKGFTVGGHSIDHPVYASLSLEDQAFQTIESVKFIRKQFSLEYGAFAFPHTDTCISLEFFKRIRESNVIDISFGNMGMLRDITPNHIERFSMERPMLPAKEVIAWHYVRSVFKKVTGENPIIRE
jgi:peptidoglycan/xylan/chitin deacetylase (PgdA/CDA1 family)